MEPDYGIDLDEVHKVVDTADVLVVRFALIQRRLLVDARTREGEGPLVRVVPPAASIEERFKSIKQLRPRFPVPERLMSFVWPRHVQTLVTSGVWDRIVDRLVDLGHVGTQEQCDLALEQLRREERAEEIGAILGADHYQSLWERAR
mgnify:FL=1